MSLCLSLQNYEYMAVFPLPDFVEISSQLIFSDEAQIAAFYHMRTSELHLGNLQSVFLAYNSMHVNLITVDWLIW